VVRVIGLNRALRRLPGNSFNQRWGCNTTMTLKDSTGDTYLFRRRIVQTPWAAIYVHDIEKGDEQPELHSHPFPFASLILRGGYVERTASPANLWHLGEITPVVHMAGSWNVFPRGPVKLHTIIAAQPGTKTLVFTGRRRDSWGWFVEGRGLVPWKTFLLEQNREPTGRRIPGRTS
jgi:hypothetical protein